MEKRPQFSTAFQRKSFIKELIFDFFFALSSWPRLLLEVFIRTHFGARYYSFTHVVALFLVLVLIPVLIMYGPWNYYTPQVSEFIFSYWSWFLFSAAFLFAGWRHRVEVKKTAYLFTRYTYTTGDIHSFFENLRFNGKSFDARTIETLIEPAFWLIVGLLFCVCKQPIGFIIVPCSVIYGLSYAAAYRDGDDQLFDLADEWIIAAEKPNFLLNETGLNLTKGFRFYRHIPADPDLRHKAADDLFGEDEVVHAI